MLKQRIITALILIPIVIGGLFFLPFPQFAIFISVFMLAAAWEFAPLMGWRDWPKRLLYLVIIAVLLALGFIRQNDAFIENVLIGSSIFWLIALALVMAYPKSSRYWANPLSRALMGIFVIVPTFLALLYLKSLADSHLWLIFLLLLIWGADTGAYFAGRRFGRRKLAAAVSPGKSWEGVFGGLALTLVVAIVIGWANWFPQMAIWQLVLLTLVVVPISVLGDLFESMLKRFTDIKDSGNLLPGHGGVLDRIDSLTAAAPIFALSLIWLIGA